MTRRSGGLERGIGVEPTVVRAGEEPSVAAEIWRRSEGPRDGLIGQFADGLSNHLIAELDDREFLIAMRNRLRHLEQERSAPGPWRRPRRLLIRESEKTRMAGYDIKRLLSLGGEEPQAGLRDRRYHLLSYDDLRRMVTQAEALVCAGTGTPE